MMARDIEKKSLFDSNFKYLWQCLWIYWYPNTQWRKGFWYSSLTSISFTTTANRCGSSWPYTDNESKSWTYFYSFICIKQGDWTNRGLCFSRSFRLACRTFWSLTALFYSYFCFEFRNKYKFIEYKYDHKKYLKDDIKEVIQTAHTNCIRVSQRQDRKKRRSRTITVDYQCLMQVDYMHQHIIHNQP